MLRGSNIAALFAAGRVPGAAEDLGGGELDVLAAKSLTPFEAGDVLFARSPGGAGFGDPLERETEAVAADTSGGLVSERAAREVYGVAGTDAALTEARRTQLRAARLREGRPAAAALAACPHCGPAQTLIRDIPLASLGEHYARCRTDFTLREEFCAGCGTALRTHLQPAAAS